MRLRIGEHLNFPVTVRRISKKSGYSREKNVSDTRFVKKGRKPAVLTRCTGTVPAYSKYPAIDVRQLEKPHQLEASEPSLA